MKLKHPICKPLKIALVAALLPAPFGWFGNPARAVEPPKTEDQLHLRYAAYWGGLHIADFALSLKTDENGFENQFHLKSRGLVWFFTELDAEAKSKGAVVSSNDQRAPQFQPSHYFTEYKSRKHWRWVDITFGEEQNPAKAVTGTSPIEGKEDKWDPKDKGPEVLDKVEPDKTVGTMDPVTLVPQLMAFVDTHLSGGPKEGVLPGFDGRRRFDMKATYLGPATRTVGEAKYETYRVRVKPIPVAGFKKRHEKIWNKAAYDFYFSRNGKFIPVQIYPVKSGPVLNFVKECAGPCDLKEELD
ncbi:DUF3108 domain-containing protein [Magnetovibrio sp. PR-2]|uniref:DUF3108 domain-containing protein n=1 Tax=Magnetovibrio sp. PR-2 TaxID=3120356 RepID=UPI002FCE0B4A